MSTSKRRLTDIQVLAICHFFGLVLVSFYGANVFDIVEKFAGPVGYLLLPINRSMWEMSKMLIVPVTIIFTLEYFIIGRRIRNFIPVHVMIASLLPLVMMGALTIFRAAFGSLSMQGAQAVFFLALIIAAFLLSIAILTSKKDLSKHLPPFLILYIILCILYAVFSFVQPELKIFFDFDTEVFGPLF